jgi:hypothetical protein
MKTTTQIDHREWKDWRGNTAHSAIQKLNDMLDAHGVRIEVLNGPWDDYLELEATSESHPRLGSFVSTPQTDAVIDADTGDSSLIHNLAKLCRELEIATAKLSAWKEAAKTILNEWEEVWETAGKPGKIGVSKAEAVRDFILSNVSDQGRSPAKENL